MPSPNKRRRTLPVVAVTLLALLAAFIGKNGINSLHRVPEWTWFSVKLKLSLEQDPSAGACYDRTGSAPLPLATVVKELHEAWPEQSIAVIHNAALEVGTALLHREDIEIGELVGGKFVPSKSAPWDTNERMISAVKTSTVLFENNREYVFRRK